MTIPRLAPNGPDIVLTSAAKLLNLGNSGASKNVDWGKSPIQQVTLTQGGAIINCVSSLPPGESCRVTLLVQQDATGNRTPSLPLLQAPTGGITWSTAPLAIDVLDIIWDGAAARCSLFGGGY